MLLYLQCVQLGNYLCSRISSLGCSVVLSMQQFQCTEHNGKIDRSRKQSYLQSTRPLEQSSSLLPCPGCWCSLGAGLVGGEGRGGREEVQRESQLNNRIDDRLEDTKPRLSVLSPRPHRVRSMVRLSAYSDAHTLQRRRIPPLCVRVVCVRAPVLGYPGSCCV